MKRAGHISSPVVSRCAAASAHAHGTRRTATACALGLLGFIMCACLTLVGCGGAVTTDETGGITADMTDETAQNEVNPGQIPDSSFIYDASIIDLQSADSYMEGQTVQVTGEVVGDLIVSDYNPDERWVTLQANDGTYAEVSVSMPFTMTRVIDTYGVYGKRGTTLQVRGIFSLACADHDGLTDIHADHVSLVSRGATNEIPFDIQRFIPGILLVCIGGGLTFVYRYLSERRR